MNSIKVLDVTLRDGGCVNNFNFGQVYMEKILKAQEESKVEMIEMGYLDDKNGSESGRTQYLNEQVISQHILKKKKPGVKYLAMMDYGKYDVNNLQKRNKGGIDGIRLAFHKKDMYKIIPVAKIITEKGYEVYIQPMITLRYSDSELIELINLVNREIANASGFYIVDSFGEMRPNDMHRALHLVDHNLKPSMLLGFHSHNNLQMSYSNAVAMLQFPTNRDIMIDCSIMGMGKGAGNLNTELLLEHLNLYYGKQYCIAPLLEVIDKVINQLHNEFYWGYAPEYYLSSANHCTPSYASHFYNKHMLPIDQVAQLLGMIAEEKKISFDVNYAEELYRIYNERKHVNDTSILEEFKSLFSNKKILLIGPGKSILKYHEEIDRLCNSEETISIGLNLTDKFSVDYLMITRFEIFETAKTGNIPIITTSNISKGTRGNVKVLDYKKWISVKDSTYDSSTVIIINFLQACGVKDIYLAGLDGFSVNINENYSNPLLRRPVTEEQATKRNKYYEELFSDLKRKGINIAFITPSKYDNQSIDMF